MPEREARGKGLRWLVLCEGRRFVKVTVQAVIPETVETRWLFMRGEHPPQRGTAVSHARDALAEEEAGGGRREAQRENQVVHGC
jgi:hypothetical protein